MADEILRMPLPTAPPEERELRRLQAIARMADQRRHPRQIKGHDLAPKEVNDRYEAFWAEQDRELLAAEERKRIGGRFKRFMRMLRLVR